MYVDAIKIFQTFRFVLYIALQDMCSEVEQDMVGKNLDMAR